MAPHPLYPLLDADYDAKHRAHLITDNLQPWPFEDEGSLPTVAYLWKNCVNVTGNKDRRYLYYTNEFDVITPNQVKWTPYSRPEIENMNLSPICKRDENYWRATIPLVWFFVVEWHLPQRVVRQFGLLQQPDVHQETTNRELHKIDRRKVRGPVDWVVKHQPYISLWDARERFSMYPYDGPAHRNGPYKEYLVWFHNNARVFIRPPVNIAELQESESDDDNDHMDGYDQATRESTQTERAPLHNYTKMRRSCRRLALKLNCITTPDCHEPQPSRSTSGRGTAPCSQQRTPSRSICRGASPSAATSSRSRRQSQSRQPSDSEEDDASEEHDPSYGQDIIASSQLGDAPAATQQSVRRAGRRRARDTSEVGSANILGTNPGRQKKKKNPYTPSGR
ncbi:hypothetical protein EJB05_10138 [Eragrostis curvula]|uniref:Aminotransferase-like plant mobile domain-containing protein n=1 Tax=Eragrostis curvula TaxID=38414 RepID=A0A5J9W4G3_9POAL|nr:hypothetical protein EJB05_10138 [Eragrostis curvula]